MKSDSLNAEQEIRSTLGVCPAIDAVSIGRYREAATLQTVPTNLSVSDAGAARRLYCRDVAATYGRRWNKRSDRMEERRGHTSSRSRTLSRPSIAPLIVPPTTGIPSTADTPRLKPKRTALYAVRALLGARHRLRLNPVAAQSTGRPADDEGSLAHETEDLEVIRLIPSDPCTKSIVADGAWEDTV